MVCSALSYSTLPLRTTPQFLLLRHANGRASLEQSRDNFVQSNAVGATVILMTQQSFQRVSGSLRHSLRRIRETIISIFLLAPYFDRADTGNVFSAEINNGKSM